MKIVPSKREGVSRELCGPLPACNEHLRRGDRARDDPFLAANLVQVLDFGPALVGDWTKLGG